MDYTLITGACGGLGSAFCELLASRGEPLFLTGRSERRLEALADRLKASYSDMGIAFLPCDLTDEHARSQFFARADEMGATFKRLVYVAGVDTQMAFERYDERRIVMQTRVNLEGAASFIGGFLSRTALDGNSEILVVGSMSASTPMPYFALYSATKKALEQFCIGLHAELKGRVRVTCVLPGGIPTRDDIKENIKSHGFFGKISAKSPEEVAAASLKAVAKNKRIKVIGFCNQMLRLTTKAVPMSVKMHFISKIWSKTTKDHFS